MKSKEVSLNAYNFSVLKVSGIDSSSFLQSIITNDINSAQKGSIYAMILSPQGRFLFDTFISKINDYYLLEARNESLDKFVTKLRMYKLRKSVDIETLKGLQVSYFKDQSHIDIDAKNIIHSYADPRYKKLGVRVIAQSDCDADFNQYIEDKYKYAIPDGNRDIPYDSAIPIEYGAEELNAISYTKGCYIGQELISRTKYQGVVRKKIFKLVSESSVSIENHDILNINQKKIGSICSYWANTAIALLRIEDIESDIITIEGKRFKIITPEWHK